MSFFGSPFGMGGGLSPYNGAGAGQSDQFYTHKWTEPPNTPLDVYEREEDKNLAGNFFLAVIAFGVTLGILHRASAAQEEGLLISRGGGNATKRMASHKLDSRLEAMRDRGDHRLEDMGRHVAVLKNKHASPEQRSKACSELQSFLYGANGLNLSKEASVLKYNPSKYRLFNRFKQHDNVLEVQEAHKVLQESLKTGKRLRKHTPTPPVGEVEKKNLTTKKHEAEEDDLKESEDTDSSFSSEAERHQRLQKNRTPQTTLLTSQWPDLSKGFKPEIQDAVLNQSIELNKTKKPIRDHLASMKPGHYQEFNKKLKSHRNELLDQASAINSSLSSLHHIAELKDDKSKQSLKTIINLCSERMATLKSNDSANSEWILHLRNEFGKTKTKTELALKEFHKKDFDVNKDLAAVYKRNGDLYTQAKTHRARLQQEAQLTDQLYHHTKGQVKASSKGGSFHSGASDAAADFAVFSAIPDILSGLLSGF